MYFIGYNIKERHQKPRQLAIRCKNKTTDFVPL